VDGGGGGGGQPQVGGLDLGAWGKVVLEEVAGCHCYVAGPEMVVMWGVAFTVRSIFFFLFKPREEQEGCMLDLTLAPDKKDEKHSAFFA